MHDPIAPLRTVASLELEAQDSRRTAREPTIAHLLRGDRSRDSGIRARPHASRQTSMTRAHFNRGLYAFTLGFVILASRANGADFDPTHALLTRVLTNFVKDARVNYAALAAQPRDLDRYLAQLAAVGNAEFTTWSEPQRIAFLINAYNAYTLRLVTRHYPLRSIRDIGNILSGPWQQPVVHLFGETIDLDTLEHQILRVDYTEPRLHFALVCAAKGCPPLRGEAYVADRLEEQLVDQAKRFLADSTKNRIVASERVAHLSPLFKWYRGDFEKVSGSVLAALKPYWPDPPTSTDGFRILYTEYDWSLNAQTR